MESTQTSKSEVRYSRLSKVIGSVISNEGSNSDILSRIVQATVAMTKLKLLCKDKNI